MILMARKEDFFLKIAKILCSIRRISIIIIEIMAESPVAREKTRAKACVPGDNIEE
jgi:hypothetical protein